MATKRIFSRKANTRINSRPDHPLDGEPEMVFAMFQRWLEADGTLSWAALGAEFERAGDTCRRYADIWRWQQRLQLIRAINKEPAEEPAKPAKPATKALSPTRCRKESRQRWRSLRGRSKGPNTCIEPCLLLHQKPHRD